MGPEHSYHDQSLSKQIKWLKRLDEFIFRYLAMPDYPYLRAVRYSLMVAMPLLLAAAFALLVRHFPLEVYQQFMVRTFGAEWYAPCDLIYFSTIEIFAIIMSLSLSYQLVEMHNERYSQDFVHPVGGMLVALSALFIIIGPKYMGESIVLPWVGLRGLFGSLIITTGFMALFLRLCRIKTLRFEFFEEQNDFIIAQFFLTFVPALLSLLLFLLLRYALVEVGVPSLHQALYAALQYPFSGAQDSFSLGALYTLLVQICWFFGIHGPDLLDPLTHDVFQAHMLANSVAFNAQQVPQHIYTKVMLDTFVFIGGAGSTLALICAIFFGSRDAGSRRVAYIGLGPSVFNINEFILFGLPIVFNPVFLIPFILVPFILLVVSATAINLGLVPQPVFSTQWTTPPFFNGYITTGSWRGVALQVVNFGIAVLAYLPFVSLADRRKDMLRREAFVELVEMVRKESFVHLKGTHFGKSSVMAALGRMLINHLEQALHVKDASLMLYFQPRINFVKKAVPTVECLVRWKHPVFGFIPPQLIFALAEEGGQLARLEDWIASMAVLQQGAWQSRGIHVAMVVNISERQLDDKDFIKRLMERLARFDLPPRSFVLEVNEGLALDPYGRYLSTLQKLHAFGFRLSIDNYGKHFQTLNQLRHVPVTDLQIDRGLVQAIAFNKSSQDIMAAIQEMCQELGIDITAGYVESREQLETLLELNISTFQGYLFTEAAPASECEEFIRSFGKS